MSLKHDAVRGQVPNLAGVATKNLVEQKGGGSFSASYINWARTLNLLHDHAPGWMVKAVQAEGGGILHKSPVGGYLLLQLAHEGGLTTPAVPQAVMDNRNNAIPFDRISARDITDTHRRGACLVLAMHFGLAYELWAKDEMESGYHSGSKTDALAESLRDIPAGAGAALDASIRGKPSSQKKLDSPTKNWNATAEVDGKGALPDIGSGVDAQENGKSAVAGGTNRGHEISSEKISEKPKEPDPSRPVGNVFEAIERVKHCKTAKGANKSMSDSIFRFRFSKNDRRRMQEAVNYRISKIEEGE